MFARFRKYRNEKKKNGKTPTVERATGGGSNTETSNTSKSRGPTLLLRVPTHSSDGSDADTANTDNTDEIINGIADLTLALLELLHSSTALREEANNILQNLELREVHERNARLMHDDIFEMLVIRALVADTRQDEAETLGGMRAFWTEDMVAGAEIRKEGVVSDERPGSSDGGENKKTDEAEDDSTN